MAAKIQLKLFIIFVCVGISLPALADQNPEEESLEKKFIESNIAISEWFDGLAEDLDIFIAGKKLTNRKNETAVKVSNSTYVSEGEDAQNATSAGVLLRLPNVEQYWHLKFTNYDQREESRLTQKPQLRQAPAPKSYGATLGIIQKLGDVRTSFEPRIQLSDPLKISHLLAFESLAENKNYQVNPRLEFFADPDEGTGILQILNFRFRLTDIYSFMQVNDAEYEDKEHMFSVTNGFAIGQIVSQKSAISYGIYFNSNNRPSYHLESYNLAVTWSHLIYKNILDYSFTPQLNFLKEKGFVGVPGAAFSINLNF